MKYLEHIIRILEKGGSNRRQLLFIRQRIRSHAEDLGQHYNFIIGNELFALFDSQYG